MALRQTAELSYFVDEKQRRRGIGRALIAFIESQCAPLQIKTLFAVILDHNEGSIALIEKCGYAQWGRLPGVARFGAEERGHLYYGKRIIP
jgi:phosphinothricin acetyltransferase